MSSTTHENKRSLIIGGSSQLAQYFPDDWIRVSSRDINFKEIESEQWSQIHVCFSEQRTYLANDPKYKQDFWSVNYDKTIDVISRVSPLADKVVFYSTAELWNKRNGSVTTETPFLFHENHYTESKAAITEHIRSTKYFSNVAVVYPFNFNGPTRRPEYMFGKVFRSIAMNIPITLGDIDYRRELLHPSMVAIVGKDQVISGGQMIAGSGIPVYIKGFVERLYRFFGRDMERLVTFNHNTPSIYRKHVFYSATIERSFNEDRVFQLTADELKCFIEERKYHNESN